MYPNSQVKPLKSISAKLLKFEAQSREEECLGLHASIVLV